MVLEAGDSFMPPKRMELDERSMKQRRIKAELIADGLKLSNIDAMALGATDWTIGTAWLRQMVDDKDLPVLAANLTCDGKNPYPASKIVESGGRRVGVVGITDGEVEGCEVGDPIAALQAAFDKLGEVDVSIALLPVRTAPDMALLTNTDLAFDIGFDARGTHTRAAGDKKGKIWMYGAGNKGKTLGILTLGFVEGATTWEPSGQTAAIQERVDRIQTRLDSTKKRAESETDPNRKALFEKQVKSYEGQLERETKLLEQAGNTKTVGNKLGNEEVQLARTIKNHEATEKLVVASKAKIGDEQTAASPNIAPHKIPEGVYAGSDACATCHRPEFLQWAGTAHARSYQTLYSEKRHMDDDCFSCHVTGAGEDDGPKSPVQVKGFRDVQCEACHGPSRAHSVDPTNAELKPNRDPGQQVCVKCHDGDNDGGRFDFPHYRPKIVHKSSE